MFPRIEGIVKQVLENNAAFVKSHGPEYFKPFLDGQHPKVTVVCCSDSRVQMHALHPAPDNELFVIRNIGNQIATAEGSVEYGVHHLHTPVLLILGHVRCGAIKAASGDYSSESAPIRKELDSIRITKGAGMLENVKANLNNQVAAAMEKFGSEVASGKLVVLGCLYDFADDLKSGNGRLQIVSVNGETSRERIEALTGEGATTTPISR